MVTNLYIFLSVSAVIAAILQITIWNPIYKIIYLISLFLFGSSILLVLDFYFLGLTYFIVYIGAITILFLFVIMMVQISNPTTHNIITSKNKTSQGVLPIFQITITLITLMIILRDTSFYNTESIYNYFYNEWSNESITLTDIELFGELIYLSYPLTLILISYLLWLILIGILWITI